MKQSRKFAPQRPRCQTQFGKNRRNRDRRTLRSLAGPACLIRSTTRKSNIMPTKTTFHIAVLPGDGIGIEVIEEAVRVVEAVQESCGGFALRMTKHECGADCYQRTGDDLPRDTLEACRQADAVLLGAMGHPDI